MRPSGECDFFFTGGNSSSFSASPPLNLRGLGPALQRVFLPHRILHHRLPPLLAYVCTCVQHRLLRFETRRASSSRLYLPHRNTHRLLTGRKREKLKAESIKAPGRARDNLVSCQCAFRVDSKQTVEAVFLRLDPRFLFIKWHGPNILP